MALPKEPVTLPVKEIEELNRKLSDMRHDINNHLSLMVAAMELIRYKSQRTPLLGAWEQAKANGTAIDNASLMDFENKLKENVDQTERLVMTIGEQPQRITEAIRKFSAEFERAVGIKRSS